MSSAETDKIRVRILEILTEAAKKEPFEGVVDKATMRNMLGVTDQSLNYTMKYLSQRGLVKIVQITSVSWQLARPTRLAMEIIQDRKRFVRQFPFLKAGISESPLQAVRAETGFRQNLTEVFRRTHQMVEEANDIPQNTVKEIKMILKSLELELSKEEPDAGKTQELWKQLKIKAGWVTPVLLEAVLNGLKRSL